MGANQPQGDIKKALLGPRKEKKKKLNELNWMRDRLLYCSEQQQCVLFFLLTLFMLTPRSETADSPASETYSFGNVNMITVNLLLSPTDYSCYFFPAYWDIIEKIVRYLMGTVWFDICVHHFPWHWCTSSGLVEADTEWLVWWAVGKGRWVLIGLVR